jgi:drug/metabolite transporter (DMT)-like permease
MGNYVALAVFTTLLVAGQVFFKDAASAFKGNPVGQGLVALAFSPTFYVAITIYGAATLLWVWILSRIPLGQAYPWVALATAAVPGIAVLLFHERLSSSYWLGVGLVVLGVYLTQRGTQGI